MAKKKTKLTDVALAGLARAGKSNELMQLVRDDSSNDRVVYKWLTAAYDFGHKTVKADINDLLEVSDLRADDDGYEVASAHWELGAAYLEGTAGLPVDLPLAKKHLGLAFELHDLADLSRGTDREYSADELRSRLEGKAKALLNKYVPAPKSMTR